jgi:hypothetical protein
MFASRHGSFIWLASDKIHDTVKKVGFAMLAAEIL